MTCHSFLQNARENYALAAEDLVGHYQPISKFAEERAKISCSVSIKVSGELMQIDAAFLEKSLREVGKICSSKMDSSPVQELLRASSAIPFKEWPMYLAAIVMYTFDLCSVDLKTLPEDNFYFRLNELLRKRDPKMLRECSDYLHYLLKGLESLPSYRSDKFLWRGVDPKGREIVLKNYTLSKRVHWSGFSSASTDRAKAQDFAQHGGVLLRIRLLEEDSLGRDVQLLSAISSEKEVLLLPNIRLMVTEACRKLDGMDTIDVLELPERSDTFVF